MRKICTRKVMKNTILDLYECEIYHYAVFLAYLAICDREEALHSSNSPSKLYGGYLAMQYFDFIIGETLE